MALNSTEILYCYGKLQVSEKLKIVMKSENHYLNTAMSRVCHERADMKAAEARCSESSWI